MKKYVLDTNIYVTAARNASFGTELIQFAGSFLPQLYLHAVVVQELMLGAITTRARKQLEREVVQPFEKRGGSLRRDTLHGSVRERSSRTWWIAELSLPAV